MRLLNSRTLKLENIPAVTTPYAIVSHRWEDEEVLYEDIARDQHEIEHKVKQKAGYTKLLDACRQAKQDGLSHVWLDICSIDKASSAELSEAINSMYEWYRKADVCYAYLAGVPPGTDVHSDPVFTKHEWFKRGWTLQELIAPANVVFFSRAGDRWFRLGDKAELCETLSIITGIEVGVLLGRKSVHSTSVAKRMSWAANRETTRPEDRAYSMMGLFNVNMPMLYGEGEKAFIRLQEEIMKDSDDESLFAWVDKNASPDAHAGLLATSPNMFENSGRFFAYSNWEPRPPFHKTNRGLQITLPIHRIEDNGFCIAALNCPQPTGTNGFVGIRLKKLTYFNEPTSENQYARVEANHLFALSNASSAGQKILTRTFYVHQSKVSSTEIFMYPEHIIRFLRAPHQKNMGCRLHRMMGDESKIQLPVVQGQKWFPTDTPCAFHVAKDHVQLAAVVVYSRRDNTKFAVLLGSASDSGGVAADILRSWESQTFDELKFMFQPQKPGIWMDSGRERVRVDIKILLHSGIKSYLTDIVIEDIPSTLDITTQPDMTEGSFQSSSSSSRVRNMFKRKTN